MSTSNTFVYNDTAGQLINDVAAAQGFTSEVETLTPFEFNYYQRALNRIFKGIMVKNTQGVGVHIWQRHTGFMFLSSNTGSYELKSTCPFWTDSFLVTNAALTNKGGQATLNVVTANAAVQYPSNTGAANAAILLNMNCVIQLDSGQMFYSNITGIPSNTSVTLGTNLPSSVNGGGVCYFFSSIAQPPQVIEHVSLRDQNGNDLTLDILTDQQWHDLPGKQMPNFLGDPQAVYYEPHLVDNPTGTGFSGTLKTDVSGAVDLTKYLVIEYFRELQDINNPNNTLDCPKEFLGAVFWTLCKETIDFAQKEWTPTMEANYQRAVKLASNSNPKRTAARFVRRGYGGPWREIPHR